MNVTIRLKAPPVLKLRYLPGATGPAGQIVSVDATTLAPGEPATVVNNGTPEAAELLFGIPEGEQGIQGDAATIAVGDVTTGAAGSSASVTNVGTSGAAIFDFAIPKGDKGDPGTATIPDGDKGDITTSDDGDTWTIDAEAVDNTKLANMATGTLKGRTTAGTGDPEDLTGTEATALLDAVVGDAGSGGTKGLVPAPAAGDGLKFLRGDGIWQAPPLPLGYLSGFTLSNNATDATNDIDVAPGFARGDANGFDLTSASTVVKQIDVAFAEYSSPGTPSGGRDSTDNLTGSKWFHVFEIGGPGKNTQPFFSTSLTPTLPSGFTAKRRISSVYWTGSAIRAFLMTGRRIDWLSPPTLDVDTAALSTSSVTSTISTPVGVRVLAHLNGLGSNTSAACIVYIRQPSLTDLAPSATATPLGQLVANSNQIAAGPVSVMTNTSAQISYRASSASTTLRLATTGWTEIE